jgi:hypothetical protein
MDSCDYKKPVPFNGFWYGHVELFLFSNSTALKQLGLTNRDKST